MASENELAWIWREKEKDEQRERVKDMMRTRRNASRPPRTPKIKGVPVTVEEVKSWERFPLLRQRLQSNWPNVQLTALLNKFGPSPKCYLTGLPINYEQGETYDLDHVTPRSKGGASTLDNMQLANPAANRMKADLELGKFIDVCRMVAGRW